MFCCTLLILLLCFTSSMSFAGSYTEIKPRNRSIMKKNMPERLSFDQIFVTNKCIEKMKGGIATRNYIFSVCEKSDVNGSYTD